jgi:hypothetical protein
MERICTPYGPEIRPCPDTNLPPINDGAEIVAVRATGDGHLVQIAGGAGLKWVNVAIGQVKLKQLVSTMINRTQLPSMNLKEIPETFWYEQGEIVVDTSY